MLTEGHFQKANGAQISDIVSPISHSFVRDIIFIITLDYVACNWHWRAGIIGESRGLLFIGTPFN